MLPARFRAPLHGCGGAVGMGTVQGAEQFEPLAPLQFVTHGFGNEAAAIRFDAIDPGDQLSWHRHSYPFGQLVAALDPPLRATR